MENRFERPLYFIEQPVRKARHGLAWAARCLTSNIAYKYSAHAGCCVEQMEMEEEKKRFRAKPASRLIGKT